MVWRDKRKHGTFSGSNKLQVHLVIVLCPAAPWCAVTGVSGINIQGYDTDCSGCIQTNFKNIKITSYTAMYLYMFSKKFPQSQQQIQRGEGGNLDNSKYLYNMHY